MELVSRFFGKRSQQPHARESSHLQVASREQARRELVAMALRDTLGKHGLPAGCITAEGMPGSEVEGRRGLHVRLVFRDGQPGLLAYVVALEAAFRGRLARLDPLSTSWVTGISWRFEPTDRELWPQFPAAGPLGSEPRPGARVAAGRAVAFDSLLRLREADFRTRAAANTGFTPTLPMDLA